MVDRIKYTFDGVEYSGLDAFKYRCIKDANGNITDQAGICDDGMVRIPGYEAEDISAVLNAIGYGQIANRDNMRDYQLASPDADGDPNNNQTWERYYNTLVNNYNNTKAVR